MSNDSVHTPSPGVNPTLPCVVQLGFCGPQKLSRNGARWTEEEIAQALESCLSEWINKKLRDDLSLTDMHFFCGISQMNTGADWAFTRALGKLDLPQRVFLPLPRDEYLEAKNNQGSPNFAWNERTEALGLLNREHIIQERILGSSIDVEGRVEDVLLEMMRVCEVFVAVQRKGARSEDDPDTSRFVEMVRFRNKSLLRIEIDLSASSKENICTGCLTLAGKNASQFYKMGETSATVEAEGAWKPPSLPTVPDLRPPESRGDPQTCWRFPNVTAEQYCTHLLKTGDDFGEIHQQMFGHAANFIVAAHCGATGFATLALLIHQWGKNEEPSVPSATRHHEAVGTVVERRIEEPNGLKHSLLLSSLCFEVVLLLLGYWIHTRLHRENVVHEAAQEKYAIPLSLARGGRWVAGLALGEDAAANLGKELIRRFDSLITTAKHWWENPCRHWFVRWLRYPQAPSVEIWAQARLVAEVGRSILALNGQRRYLAHLFSHPFPGEMRQLLRTLNVLHLRSSVQKIKARDPKVSDTIWKMHRMLYLYERVGPSERGEFTPGRNAQLPYYRSKIEKASKRLNNLNRWFKRLATAATVATLIKLLLCGCDMLKGSAEEIVTAILGMGAILLPLIAVGALSKAAASDLHGIKHTYAETVNELERLGPLIENAKTESEFNSLALETESRLLGETVTWASRRSFTSV